MRSGNAVNSAIEGRLRLPRRARPVTPRGRSPLSHASSSRAQDAQTRTPASRPTPRHHTATHIRGDLPTSGSPARERTRLQRVDALLPGDSLAAGRWQEPSRPADRGTSGAIARRLPRRVRCPARRGRYRRVAIANENCLVVPDALGTTIKLTSLATWRCPLAGRRWATASGQVLRPMHRACRRDVPRDLLLPIPESRQRTGSLWLQRAEGLATQCERGRVRSAPAGTPAESERVTPSVPGIVEGVQIYLFGVSSVPPGRRRRSSGSGLTRTGRRARRVASQQSSQADQRVVAPARAGWLLFMRAALGRPGGCWPLGVACRRSGRPARGWR
jgi:hypothetical protein